MNKLEIWWLYLSPIEKEKNMNYVQMRMRNENVHGMKDNTRG